MSLNVSSLLQHFQTLQRYLDSESHVSMKYHYPFFFLTEIASVDTMQLACKQRTKFTS